MLLEKKCDAGMRKNESARTNAAFLHIGETDCVAEDAVSNEPVSGSKIHC